MSFLGVQFSLQVAFASCQLAEKAIEAWSTTLRRPKDEGSGKLVSKFALEPEAPGCSERHPRSANLSASLLHLISGVVRIKCVVRTLLNEVRRRKKADCIEVSKAIDHGLELAKKLLFGVSGYLLI